MVHTPDRTQAKVTERVIQNILLEQDSNTILDDKKVEIKTHESAHKDQD